MTSSCVQLHICGHSTIGGQTLGGIDIGRQAIIRTSEDTCDAHGDATGHVVFALLLNDLGFVEEQESSRPGSNRIARLQNGKEFIEGSEALR